MKRLIVTIFAFFYLCLSTGATVHLHYCMGKLVELSLWHENKNGKCGGCGMPKSQKKTNKSCCKDEQKSIKIVNDQKATANEYQILQASFNTVASSFIELPVGVISPVIDKSQVSHSPPRSSEAGIYLLNCVFRI